jgi:hypothetical protein
MTMYKPTTRKHANAWAAGDAYAALAHERGQEIDFGAALAYAERHGAPAPRTGKAAWEEAVADGIRAYFRAFAAYEDGEDYD